MYRNEFVHVPVSQIVPVKPAWQLHVYLELSSASIHCPLFWHGLDEHLMAENKLY